MSKGKGHVINNNLNEHLALLRKTTSKAPNVRTLQASCLPLWSKHLETGDAVVSICREYVQRSKDKDPTKFFMNALGASERACKDAPSRDKSSPLATEGGGNGAPGKTAADASSNALRATGAAPRGEKKMAREANSERGERTALANRDDDVIFAGSLEEIDELVNLGDLEFVAPGAEGFAESKEKGAAAHYEDLAELVDSEECVAVYGNDLKKRTRESDEAQVKRYCLPRVGQTHDMATEDTRMDVEEELGGGEESSESHRMEEDIPFEEIEKIERDFRKSAAGHVPLELKSLSELLDLHASYSLEKLNVEQEKWKVVDRGKSAQLESRVVELQEEIDRVRCEIERRKCEEESGASLARSRNFAANSGRQRDVEVLSGEIRAGRQGVSVLNNGPAETMAPALPIHYISDESFSLIQDQGYEDLEWEEGIGMALSEGGEEVGAADESSVARRGEAKSSFVSVPRGSQTEFIKIPPVRGFEIEQYDPITSLKSRWHSEGYPWSRQVVSKIKEVFGHHKWRTNQLEIINAVMSKKDVLVTMPTGGGKSLCYQVPALVLPGVTVVVEPLISLIEDQVMILEGLEVPVAFLGKSQSDQGSAQTYKALGSSDPKIKILFVTPEKLTLNKRLQLIMDQLYACRLLTMFVIDECHCVSQWGHAFRPRYKQLAILKRMYPNVPILAMTATATPNIKTDILNMLGLSENPENVVCFTSSFDRPNLYFEVRKKTDRTLDEIYTFITTQHPDESGIIYCFSKRNCDELSEKLKVLGMRCDHYYASLDLKVRSSIQRDWMDGKLQFICATIAFGMGINKPDVRWVIHHSLPKSLEGYYQEVGRAGRDGGQAECLLFYREADRVLMERMILKDQSEEGEHHPYLIIKNNKDKLHEMVAYIQNQSDCRRGMLLQYFGQVNAAEGNCGNCDNCLNPAGREVVDVSDVARAVLEVVRKVPRRLTKAVLVKVIEGKGVLEEGISVSLPSPKRPKHIVERVISRLVIDGKLNELYQNTAYGNAAYLTLGTRSSVDDFVRAGCPMQFTMRIGTSTLASADATKKKKSPSASRSVKKNVQPSASTRTLQIRGGGNQPRSSPRKPSSDKALEESEDDVLMLALPDPCHAPARKSEDPNQQDIRSKLLARLMQTRAEIEEEERHGNVHKTRIEVLYPQHLIVNLANALPRTQEEVAKVDGVGNTRAEKYGTRFAYQIAKFLNEYPELKPNVVLGTSPYFKKSDTRSSVHEPLSREKVKKTTIVTPVNLENGEDHAQSYSLDASRCQPGGVFIRKPPPFSKKSDSVSRL
ncbi:uncharacterized protein LOC126329579 [Schistocerca gregaria]|uniref:uncharacterized protein LOC126329579 n=1 Tax=Schistocerca gregaria TaxID=7010 RepID=UPI00211F0197|nr:uncharacterized protein LOC126329579 [Schistocerca gregaria]